MGSTSGSSAGVGHHRVGARGGVRSARSRLTGNILHLLDHMTQPRKSGARPIEPPARSGRRRPSLHRPIGGGQHPAGGRPAPPAHPAAGAIRRAVRHQPGHHPGGAVADGGGRRAGGRRRRPPPGRPPARSPGPPAGQPVAGPAAPWDGGWTLAVVTETRRPVSARAELRRAMGVLRLAELREGVWLRPDNLDEGWAGPARAVVAAQCRRFTSPEPEDPPARWPPGCGTSTAGPGRPGSSGPAGPGGHPARGGRHRRPWVPGSCCRPTSCATCWPTRCCPPGLLPARLAGRRLRADYDRYDRAFKRLWRDWFRREADR